MIEPSIWGYTALFVAFCFSLAAASIWQPSIEGNVNRYRSIDGLRGFLALAVVAHHFLISWNFVILEVWMAPDNTLFHNLGPIAVSAFFMITALLFYGRLVNKEGIIDWAGLYVNRLVRIAPLFLVAAALTAVIAVWHQDFKIVVAFVSFVASIGRWLAFSFLGSPTINGYENTKWITAGVVWTLRYEWAFYLSLPLVALSLRKLGKVGSSTRIVIIVALFVLIAAVPTIKFTGFSSDRLLPFILGMLVFELVQFDFIVRRLQSTVVSILIVIALALCLLLPGDSFHWARMVLLAAAFLCVAAGNSLFGILVWRPSLTLGDASYAIYLLHGIVLHLVFYWVPRDQLDKTDFWLVLPLVFFCVSLLSIAVYRLFERPIILKGKAVYSAWANRRLTALTLSEKIGI